MKCVQCNKEVTIDGFSIFIFSEKFNQPIGRYSTKPKIRWKLTEVSRYQPEEIFEVCRREHHNEIIVCSKECREAWKTNFKKSMRIDRTQEEITKEYMDGSLKRQLYMSHRQFQGGKK